MIWLEEKIAPIVSLSHNVADYLGMQSVSDGLGGKVNRKKKYKAGKKLSKVQVYRSRINKAKGYSEVWEIVRDSVKDILGKHRVAMMLFLDDLPLHLGAYHPLGTNNIVLNRILVQIVEAATKSKHRVNAFVYSLLLHEYLHALGHVPEAEVRSLVHKISKNCFGEDHIITKLAEKSPWALLQGISLNGIEAPKRAIEIVKDFERPDQAYIV